MKTIPKRGAKEVQEGITTYVKNKNIDSFIGLILEDIIKEKPSNAVAHAIEFIYRHYGDEVKQTLNDVAINIHGSPESKDSVSRGVRGSEKKTPMDTHSIQSELESYLDSSNINQLFVRIVENIVLEKPAVPSVFVVEFLLRQFPAEAQVAVFNINPGKLVRMPAATKTNTDNNVLTAKKVIDSDSEDDEGDYIAELAEVDEAPIKAKPVNRRFSVSSESINMDRVKDQMHLVADIPKTPEVALTLYKTVSKSAMLRRMLEPEQRELIVKAFAGPLIKQEGEDVITQGDIGDVFYLLEDGTVDVFIRNTDGTEGETKVHTYKAGDAFGQLALMYNAPRAATCRVSSSDAKLWALDRTSFKLIIASSAVQKRDYYMSFLTKVPLLQELSEGELMRLADSLTEEKFENGSTVCSQGEEGNEFYLVKDGQAVCTQSSEDGVAEGVVGSLSTGDYFGEIALLTAKPRQATVRAIGTLRVLAIDRATFTRVFGSLEEVLRRNIDQYTKYVSASESDLTQHLQ